jgi:hypothetical protein
MPHTGKLHVSANEKHKGTGQAVVYLNGKAVYLGSTAAASRGRSGGSRREPPEEWEVNRGTVLARGG